MEVTEKISCHSL